MAESFDNLFQRMSRGCGVPGVDMLLASPHGEQSVARLRFRCQFSRAECSGTAARRTMVRCNENVCFEVESVVTHFLPARVAEIAAEQDARAAGVRWPSQTDDAARIIGIRAGSRSA